jgi:hypothetical protein
MVGNQDTAVGVKGPGGLRGDGGEEGPAVPAGRCLFSDGTLGTHPWGPSYGTGADDSPSIVKDDQRLHHR